MGFLQVNIPLKANKEVLETYWHKLWEQYTTNFNEVFIQCWNNETDAMGELFTRSKKVRREGLVHYFRVSLTEENRLFLKEQSFDDDRLKWFMVRFMKEDGTEGIEVRDYGAETTFNQISTDDAEKLLARFAADHIEAKFEKDEHDK